MRHPDSHHRNILWLPSTKYPSFSVHLKPMKSGHLVSLEVFYLMRHGVAELMRHKVYEVCLCKMG